MAYVLHQEDFHQFMRRSPVRPQGDPVRTCHVQEAEQPVLFLQLEQKGFGKGALYNFSANFERDVLVKRLQEDTLVSLHFQLAGCSDATISRMGSHPFFPNTHNLMYFDNPELDLLFPAQAKYRYMIIALSTAALQEKFEHMPEAIDPLWQAIRQKESMRFFHQNLPIQPAMRQVLQDMQDCPFTGPWQSFYLETKAMEMLTLQIGQYQALVAGKRSPQELSARETDLLTAVRQYATMHFLEPLSLQGIARTFAMNEYQLKKGFRQLFGQTLFQYVHQCKMEYARQQLTTGEKQVSETAYELGYSHPSHFIQSFKKYYGVLPGQVSNER